MALSEEQKRTADRAIWLLVARMAFAHHGDGKVTSRDATEAVQAVLLIEAEVEAQAP